MEKGADKETASQILSKAYGEGNRSIIDNLKDKKYKTALIVSIILAILSGLSTITQTLIRNNTFPIFELFGDICGIILGFIIIFYIGMWITDKRIKYLKGKKE